MARLHEHSKSYVAALFHEFDIPITAAVRGKPLTHEKFCLADAPGVYRWRNMRVAATGFAAEVQAYHSEWPINRPLSQKRCVCCKNLLPRGKNLDPDGNNTRHYQFFKTTIWQLKARKDKKPTPYRCELCRHAEILQSLKVCDAVDRNYVFVHTWNSYNILGLSDTPLGSELWCGYIRM